MPRFNFTIKEPVRPETPAPWRLVMWILLVAAGIAILGFAWFHYATFK
jgi:hypothetical protein